MTGMHPGHSRLFRVLALFLILLLAEGLRPCRATAGEGWAALTENEWNYVDQSLDISGGIPKGITGALAEIRDRGVLRVVTSPWYPPQEFIDASLSGQDQYVGADMELARLIAERMGVSLEIIPAEFSAVLSIVADGGADLAISAISYTPTRAMMTEMSRGYHYAKGSAGTSLLVRKENAESFPDASSLDGRILVAQRGSLQEALAAEHFPRYLEFRRFSSIQEVYDAVESGAADAAVVDADIAGTHLENHPDCALTLLPQFSFQLDEALDGDRIVARKGELYLIGYVNAVLEEVLASGQYEQWFDAFSATSR